jgi:hypothetical protein
MRRRINQRTHGRQGSNFVAKFDRLDQGTATGNMYIKSPVSSRLINDFGRQTQHPAIVSLIAHPSHHEDRHHINDALERGLCFPTSCPELSRNVHCC